MNAENLKTLLSNSELEHLFFDQYKDGIIAGINMINKVIDGVVNSTTIEDKTNVTIPYKILKEMLEQQTEIVKKEFIYKEKKNDN